jgi:hypothetical protein
MGQIVWKKDPDFGYNIVDVDAPANTRLLDKVPMAILDPRRWYQTEGRGAEYEAWVATMKADRRLFLERYGVDAGIVAATSGA